MRVLRLLMAASALALLGAAPARAPRCDRLFVGGVVHTPAGAQRLEVAVSAGAIVALVRPGDAGPWRKSASEVVDVASAHVYAGFTESHGHLTGYGASLEQVDLRDAASLADLVERARRAAAAVPQGTWIVGRGWDQNLWPGRAFPTNAALSAAVPDHPVLLRRVDGHAVFTNARGLAAAGITAATKDPPGGRILRDSAGTPTGVLVDDAAELLERVVPPSTAAAIERQILLACRHLAAFGVTEFHDAGTTGPELAAMRRLADARRLPLRVYVMLLGSDDHLLDTELPAGPHVEYEGMITVRAVKLYADGALGSRGALLSQPYADEPATHGLEVTPEARLATVILRAAKAGFQPCVHAIGDAAVTRVLDLYERELGGGDRGVRPRIEHAQVVRPVDVPRFATLGVIASVQPTHCTSDMPWVPARLGPDRIAWAYRWRSLLTAGVQLCLGSDVPVESPDPRLGIWAAVTRRTPEGTPREGWNTAEALTPAEAIAGYTSWAAYAGFEESRRGTIAVGRTADLTIFDRALENGEAAAILQARVVRTVVAGRNVFVARSGT